MAYERYAVGLLEELCNGEGLEPTFTNIREEEGGHPNSFSCMVEVAEYMAIGYGPTNDRAREAAAQALLGLIGEDPKNNIPVNVVQPLPLEEERPATPLNEDRPDSPRTLALERDMEDGPVVSLQRLHRRADEIIAPTEEQVQELGDYFTEYLNLFDYTVTRDSVVTAEGNFSSAWHIDTDPEYYYTMEYHQRAPLELAMIRLAINGVLEIIKLRAWVRP